MAKATKWRQNKNTYAPIHAQLLFLFVSFNFLLESNGVDGRRRWWRFILTQRCWFMYVIGCNLVCIFLCAIWTQQMHWGFWDSWLTVPISVNLWESNHTACRHSHINKPTTIWLFLSSLWVRTPKVHFITKALIIHIEHTVSVILKSNEH